MVKRLASPIRGHPSLQTTPDPTARPAGPQSGSQVARNDGAPAPRRTTSSLTVVPSNRGTAATSRRSGPLRPLQPSPAVPLRALPLPPLPQRQPNDPDVDPNLASTPSIALSSNPLEPVFYTTPVPQRWEYIYNRPLPEVSGPESLAYNRTFDSAPVIRTTDTAVTSEEVRQEQRQAEAVRNSQYPEVPDLDSQTTAAPPVMGAQLGRRRRRTGQSQSQSQSQSQVQSTDDQTQGSTQNQNQGQGRKRGRKRKLGT